MPKEVQLKYGGSGGRPPPEKFLKISEQNSFRNKYFFLKTSSKRKKKRLSNPKTKPKPKPGLKS